MRPGSYGAICSVLERAGVKHDAGEFHLGINWYNYPATLIERAVYSICLLDGELVFDSLGDHIGGGSGDEQPTHFLVEKKAPKEKLYAIRWRHRHDPFDNRFELVDENLERIQASNSAEELRKVAKAYKLTIVEYAELYKEYKKRCS